MFCYRNDSDCERNDHTSMTIMWTDFEQTAHNGTHASKIGLRRTQGHWSMFYFYQPERMVVGGYVLMIPVMLARKYFSPRIILRRSCIPIGR